MKIKFIHITIAWLLFAVFMTVVMGLVHPITKQPYDFFGEFIWESAFALVWIPSTPFVLFLARRFPVQKNDVLKNILVLFSVGFALSTVQCIAHGFLNFAMNPVIKQISANLILTSLFYNIDKMLIIFCVLVVMQHAFNYYRESRERELKASQLEAQLAQAQMQALKMQLNPHFLFNTLNSVVTLIHKDPDVAEQMTVRLSDFLRLTLESSGKQVVQLREELEFVQAYLGIEKIRFQDRLNIQLNAAPEILDIAVPNLILQPLVENAVKHGISRSSGNGEIIISAMLNSGVLKLSVKDNGTEVNGSRDMTDGIGLSNTRARLLRMYGGDASLQLQPMMPRGVEAVITIPMYEELHVQ